MVTKIVIEMVVKCADDDEIASIVNDQLDEGVQDVIAEWLEDRYGGEMKFIDSRCHTEDLSPRDRERIADGDCSEREEA